MFRDIWECREGADLQIPSDKLDNRAPMIHLDTLVELFATAFNNNNNNNSSYVAVCDFADKPTSALVMEVQLYVIIVVTVIIIVVVFVVPEDGAPSEQRIREKSGLHVSLGPTADVVVVRSFVSL